jgi:hypothetical protein
MPYLMPALLLEARSSRGSELRRHCIALRLKLKAHVL